MLFTHTERYRYLLLKPEVGKGLREREGKKWVGRGKIQASKNRTRVILRREEQGGGEESTSCENTAALNG